MPFSSPWQPGEPLAGGPCFRAETKGPRGRGVSKAAGRQTGPRVPVRSPEGWRHSTPLHPFFPEPRNSLLTRTTHRHKAHECKTPVTSPSSNREAGGTAGAVPPAVRPPEESGDGERQARFLLCRDTHRRYARNHPTGQAQGRWSTTPAKPLPPAVFINRSRPTLGVHGALPTPTSAERKRLLPHSLQRRAPGDTRSSGPRQHLAHAQTSAGLRDSCARATSASSFGPTTPRAAGPRGDSRQQDRPGRHAGGRGPRSRKSSPRGDGPHPHKRAGNSPSLWARG